MDSKFVSVAGELCFSIKSPNSDVHVWRDRALQHILHILDQDNREWMQWNHIHAAYSVGRLLWKYLTPAEVLQLLEVSKS